MRKQKIVLWAACGLVLALGTGLAWAQEDEGGARPRPPFGRAEGGQRNFQRPGGFGMPGGAAGGNIPVVQEEMQRHREALRDILVGNIALVREVGRSLLVLRQAGADDAEIETATKKFAPQAAELAGKMAAEFATHYANLAKIYKPEDEAKRKEVIDQLAEEIVERMSTRVGQRQPGFGGMGDRPFGGGRFRRDAGGEDRPRGDRPRGGRGEGGGAPENF